MMIRYLLLLLLVSLLLMPDAAAAGPAGCDSSFSVLTFNLRYNNPGDSLNAWPNRKERVAALIRFHHADLCGFQEALKGQIDDLAKELPDFAWCGVGRDDGFSAGEFSPVFYRKGRFNLLRNGTFWLSPSPRIAGSKGWDAALPRIVTWALLLDRSTGKECAFFNTHFDHQGVTARRLSAQLLLDSVRTRIGTLPVIVTGDFNSTDTSIVYRIMTGGELRDALKISRVPHYGPMSTWNGFREIEPGNRIDFIYVSDRVEVLTHAIITDRWDGRFPSDHLPVIAGVRLN